MRDGLKSIRPTRTASGGRATPRATWAILSCSTSKQPGSGGGHACVLRHALIKGRMRRITARIRFRYFAFDPPIRSGHAVVRPVLANLAPSGIELADRFRETDQIGEGNLISRASS